jgi:16S rRNA (guanine966-N2)-methyltransferase
MRIIAGEFRGRKLLPPKGETTRPITDRVKQSLFDTLAPEIPDSVVFDCFAGTGSMGLEALSRGASHAVFFEADRSAAAILRRNIEALGVAGRSRVFAGDVFNVGWVYSPTDAAGGRVRPPYEPCSLLFLDPPYRFLRERAGDLQRLVGHLAARHLAANAIVVFRHDAADALDLPPLVRYDLRTYGSMIVELLTCPSTPTSSSPQPTPHG